MADLECTDTAGLPTLDAARHEIAREACYEVQTMAEVLRDFIDRRDPGAEVAALARGMLTRIYNLSDVIFEAVIQDDDQREDLPTLCRKLGLPRTPA